MYFLYHYLHVYVILFFPYALLKLIKKLAHHSKLIQPYLLTENLYLQFLVIKFGLERNKIYSTEQNCRL